MANVEDKQALEQEHRLHYRWSQLEADRCGVNIGSPIRPLPSANRTLELDPNRKYDEGDWPKMSSECPQALAKFSSCAGVYKAIDYNTFSKNACLKLSEIEMYFLASKMTRESASEWALVYLGAGTCERLRWLRDEFFPGLTVVAFDPLDGSLSREQETVTKAAEKWNSDGSRFTFFLRGYDLEKDSAWILEKHKGKRLLLISDVRGIAYPDGDTERTKSDEQNLQWQAVQRLRPERSLTKFACPEAWNQEYEYAPGVLLKQIFCYYGARELRLMIEGVPEKTRRYNSWELYAKMTFHHEHLRGQVYKTTRRPDCSRCLDCCFDCTVLWDTILSYARKNSLDADQVLDKFMKYHVYSPSDESWMQYTWKAPTPKQRWDDVEQFLQQGKLMEAIGALEAEGEKDSDDTDWANIVQNLAETQPYVVKRLKLFLHRPASRATLIKALGSLSDPFTFTGNDLIPPDEKAHHRGPPQKRQRTIWDSRFNELTGTQQRAALALGWTEATWKASMFPLPRDKTWDSLDKAMQQSLSELGECAETWDNWKRG